MKSTANAELTPYGYTAGGKVYLKGQFGEPDREIGIVKGSEEASLRYFMNRFEAMKNKISAVAELVETADNKGSFLMKLIHLREALPTYNAIGDFRELYEMIDSLRSRIEEYIAQNRVKNTAIKQGILAELQEIINQVKAQPQLQAQDFRPYNVRVKELKGKWIKTGNAESELNTSLNLSYKTLIEQFQELKRSIVGEANRKVKENAQKMKDLYQQIRKINQAGGGGEYIEKVKELHSIWREISRSLGKKTKAVSRNFKKEVDNFFTLVKLQVPDFTKKTPIEAKREILQMIQKFLDNQMPYTLNTVKVFQKTWKDIGRLNAPEDKELNLNFRILCNEVFENQFLERAVRAEYKDFNKKTPLEKINIRIEVLRKSIQRESELLSDFVARNEQKLNEGDSAAMLEKSNMVNKIKTKQRILKKLLDEREIQKMKLLDLKI